MSSERFTYSKDNPISTSIGEFDDLKHSLVLPKEIAGKRILDIGSGVTDSIEKFTALGALAVGVDLRYRTLSELQKASSAFIGEIIDVMEQDPHIYSLASQIHTVQKLQEQRTSGLNAITKGKGSYIAASGEKLPFKSNSFDFVYSRLCLSQIEDPKIFTKILNEAVRVTTPGGEIQITPYYSMHLTDNLRYFSRHTTLSSIQFRTIAAPNDMYNIVSIKKRY